MKKYISFVMAFILFFSVVDINVSALISEKCGENVIWEYDDTTKTLTVSGEGDITDYSYFSSFDDNCNKIKFIEINEGVTSIGSYFFGICENVISISIPTSITKINKCAFENCSSLKNVNYKGTKAQWDKIQISNDGNDCLKNANINFADKPHICTFGDWQILIEPTCIREGKKFRECSCGINEKESIPATGIHSFSNWETSVIETEQYDGEEVRTCSNCNFTEKRVVDNIKSNKDNLIGDADNDGNVTAKDARIVLQVVAGLKGNMELSFVNADCNKDNQITAVDARFILQIVAGLK